MNNCSIPLMHPESKLLFVLINTLLLQIPLLALTDRQMDRETNTLAARGLEEPRVPLKLKENSYVIHIILV